MRSSHNFPKGNFYLFDESLRRKWRWGGYLWISLQVPTQPINPGKQTRQKREGAGTEEEDNNIHQKPERKSWKEKVRRGRKMTISNFLSFIKMIPSHTSK